MDAVLARLEQALDTKELRVSKHSVQLIPSRVLILASSRQKLVKGWDSWVAARTVEPPFVRTRQGLVIKS
jgi:hypothetical protein